MRMILDPQLYGLFLTAALLLTLAPGPDTMFVLGAGLGAARVAVSWPPQAS
jgi:threonine/homoserine/homoserine lactone efflux protein